ncbi:hypothetical protein [Herbiconiux sp. UC225_62]|uniref:hypothetical protein n=1 Tax=Herbiconiux sp. UC225_62 TaxID=3350168 RepID=UPI0036D24717
MGKRSRWLALAVAVGALAGLAGCGSATDLPVFAEAQGPEDLLPADGTPNVIEGLDASTTRLLWEDAGATFYAARMAGSDAAVTCLVIFRGEEGVSGCGGLPVTVGLVGRPDYRLEAADLPNGSDQWTRVAEYLYEAKKPTEKGTP